MDRFTGAGRRRAGWVLLRLVMGAALLLAATSGPAAGAASGRPTRLISITRVRSPNSNFSVHVRLGFAPATFTATLNGHNVTRAFSPSIGRSRRAALAPDDGLHHGRNRLTVYAVAASGRRASAMLTFSIAAAMPLAAAPDARTYVGRGVTLTPARSIGPVGGGRLVFRWRLVRAPHGSRVRPRMAASGRLHFTPRIAGVYRLRLTISSARHRSRRAVDDAVVTALPVIKPIGIRVSMYTFVSNTPAMRIGGATIGFQGKPMIAAIYDRTSFEQLQVLHVGGGASGAQAVTSAILSWQNNPNVDAGVLVFLVAQPQTFGIDYAAYDKVIAALGGGAQVSSFSAASGWSIVGAAGTSPGAAWEHSVAAYMNGYVQIDNNLHFAFLSPSYSQFETQYQQSTSGGVLGNTMRMSLGRFDPGTAFLPITFTSQQLTVPSGCANAGGFQVVTVDAEYLLSTSEATHNRTYFTNACNAAADFQQMGAMHAFLRQVIASGLDSLVFIQSIGVDPYDGSNSELQQAWQSIGADILALGGSERKFDENNGAYAFAGGNQLPSHVGLPATGFDSSSSLSGSLSRARSFTYAPTTGSPEAFATSRLDQIVYQPRTAWPYSSTKHEQQALVYLTQQLDSRYGAPFAGSACYANNPAAPDLRAEYCDTTITDWGYWAGKVQTLARTPPTGQGFSASDWRHVTTEINQEMGWVSRPLALAAALSQPFAETSGPDSAEVQRIATKVSDSISPPNTALAAYLTALAADALNAASYLPVEDSPYGAIVGSLSAGLDLVTEYLNAPNGDPALEVKLTAHQLEQQIGSMYANAAAAFSQDADIIETDYGKLKAVATGSAFAIGASQTKALVYALRLGVAQWAYQTLFRAAYSTLYLLPPDSHNPPGTAAPNWQCFGPSNATFPFGSEPATGWFSTASARYPYPLVLAVGSGQWVPPGVALTPSKSLMDAAFANPQFDTNGNPTTYGLNADDFFNANFTYATPANAQSNC